MIGLKVKAILQTDFSGKNNGRKLVADFTILAQKFSKIVLRKQIDF